MMPFCDFGTALGQKMQQRVSSSARNSWIVNIAFKGYDPTTG
jgi:hypothetical protein